MVIKCVELLQRLLARFGTHKGKVNQMNQNQNQNRNLLETKLSV